eukprot:CAMPEP_0194532696 /NCGR_PEP_ID=MMETSP0253-20130528/70324_1 /TAXON_ID=2966 /ORGANISM="Noctiluca scintillans" /LENGTH=338 /DNA_ID=CAMNT_0039378171 /DNA_START=270 /DNA_END=1286 /DNA_ORIENTATION=-
MPTLNRHDVPEDAHFWFLLNGVISVLFTAELSLKMWSSLLSWCELLTDRMNCLEIASLLPFWVHVLLGSAHLNLQFLRAFRLFRLTRMFSLAKNSPQLQLLSVALLGSADTIELMGVMLGIACFVFASLIWYVERGSWDSDLGCYVMDPADDCSSFETIPNCFYWALTTGTTVGFGDMVPLTMMGRVVANLAMICGILVIALPVSVIAAKFQEEYQKRMDLTRLGFYLTHEEGHPSKLCLEKVSALQNELATVEASLRDLLPRARELLRETSGMVSVEEKFGGLAKTNQFLSISKAVEASILEEIAALINVVQDFLEEHSLDEAFAMPTSAVRGDEGF